ncbi:HFR012Cp [Eremothecium sinecaudum]|uniref:HFR012Cp n=1 Tax=Eremothecium sinecaudum TaxID=45286 RepID=A0A0X8HUU7_9SACH|nr:HFR012Cp [Eremothecium sinecaudum]AMD21867.1 HFR012Cp [Eremothecium sinecaudum]
MDSSSEQREKHNQYITELREQDRWLPINNVARLMKNTLPVTTKVSKDAKECMQECVSEFISFVTSEASDRCATDKRKTINGEDILISLHALGFENYAEVLKIYLAKYRQQQAVKNQMMFERRDEEGEGELGDSNSVDLDEQLNLDHRPSQDDKDLQQDEVTDMISN